MEDPLRYLRISTIRSYSQGESIFAPGQEARHIYLVISGEVKVGRLAGNRDVITNIYRANAVFGESALIETCRSGYAIAIQITKVMEWTAEQIEAVGKENPKLLHALLQTMIDRLAHHEDRIQSFTVDDARRRLLRGLLEFSIGKTDEPAPSPMWMPPLTHELLASYIGTSREVVTQFMNLFRKLGYVSYSRKGILIFRDRIQAIFAEERDAALTNIPARRIRADDTEEAYIAEHPRSHAADASLF